MRPRHIGSRSSVRKPDAQPQADLDVPRRCSARRSGNACRGPRNRFSGLEQLEVGLFARHLGDQSATHPYCGSEITKPRSKGCQVRFLPYILKRGPQATTSFPVAGPQSWFAVDRSLDHVVPRCRESFCATPPIAFPAGQVASYNAAAVLFPRSCP
jgi:hypothetical protein